MNKTRLLIADADISFNESICHSLQACSDIEVVSVEHNGNDALRRIRRMPPDVLLMDLVLPGLDGISLLRELQGIKNAPARICCTRFYSDVSLEAARRYGASYFLFKPIELHELHPIIISCSELYQSMCHSSIAPDSIREGYTKESMQIHNYLVSLGIPAKLVGCSYLVEAVRLTKANTVLMRNLSKGLYLEIARSMESTPTRIERCMRNAITTAFESGDLHGKMVTCPSNKEFINYVLRNLEM